MPTLPYLTDTSTQLTGTYSASTAALDNYITSNYVSNVSNILIANINTKQPTLTAATSLLGNGSAITNISYANITGKPTYFNTDWQTTVANKPTYFQTNWNTSIDNKPTYFNTDWNTTILNKPSTFPATMTDIYTKAEVNNISNLNSNYTSNTSNLLRTLINDTNTNISTNYLPKSGGTLSGPLTTPNITLGGTSGKINVVDDYHYIEFSQPTDTTTIQEYGTIKFNIGLTKTTRASVNSTGLTATAFYGDGANITNVPYSTITGKPTNFQADWLTTIINKPSTFPADMTNIYTKTETDGRYLKLDGTNNITSLLNINAADSTTGGTKGIIFRAGYNTTLLNYNCSILTYDHDANLFCDGLSINGWDGVSFCTGANTRNERMRIDKDGNVNIGTTGQAYKLYVNGTSYLNANSTVNGTITATTFSGSGASLTSIPFTALSGTSPYVLKAGDTMSGDLLISKTGARLTLIGGGGSGATSRFDLSSYNHGTTEPTCSFITTDNGSYSSSLNIKIKTAGNAGLNSQFSALFIKPDGNIGIGSENPNYKLYVNGTTYINGITTFNESVIFKGSFWQQSSDSVLRLYFENNGPTYFHSGNTTGNSFIFRRFDQYDIFTISETGLLRLYTTSSSIPLTITSTDSGCANCIQFINNINHNGFIGIGGTNVAGPNYKNNFFIESTNAIILNVNRTSFDIPHFIIKSTGNVGIGNLAADAGKLCIGSSVYSDGVSDGTLVISKNNAVNSHRSFKFGYDANYNFCMGDNLGNGTYTWRSTDFNIRYFEGNVGIGTIANQYDKLHINGTTCLNGIINLKSDVWHQSMDGITRMYFVGNGTSYFRAGNTSGICYAFRSSDNYDLMYLWQSGYLELLGGNLKINKTNPAIVFGAAENNMIGVANAVGDFSGSAAAGDMVIRANQKLHLQTGSGYSGLTIKSNNYVGIGQQNPACHFQVNGYANITNGSEAAISAGRMQSGSLTIGGTNADYGGSFYTGGNWSGGNTAGLLMECQNNTEIAVHDNGTRIASLMYYEGAGTNRITIGRDMGWGTASSVSIAGNLAVPNITLGSGGKINSYDDYHYIQIDQPNNTLTIQEYGTISFNIGATKAQKAFINGNGLTVNDDILSVATIKGCKFMNRYGLTTPYVSNWNSTGLSGWFIGLNQFWSGNSANAGTAYLTITVCFATTSEYCWFGRVFVKASGYTWGIVTDVKNPTSGVYEIFVTDHFDNAGNNVLRFRTSTPNVMTEDLRYKIYG